MAETLTSQQKEAIEDRGGKLLVSAAAGSGKTKVLVDRLLMYLTDETNPANIDDFLIITFTEAAAAELRSKIASKLNERIAENPTNKHLQRQIQRLYLAKISTIHAYCSSVLRDYAYKLDMSSDFRLIDDKEAAEMRSRVVEEIFDKAYLETDPDFYSFVDSQGVDRNDRTGIEIVLDIYEKSRCHLKPDEWLDGCVIATDVSSLTDASQTIWGRYMIDDLHHLVDLLIEAMENCVKLAQGDPTLTKQAALLQDNVLLLRDFRSRDTWREIMAGKDLKFGTLSFPKNPDPVIKSLIQSTRDHCKELLKAKLQRFSDSNERTLLDIQKTAPAVKGIVATVRKFADAYTAAKRKRRVVDFSDLEHITLDLLTGKNRDAVTVVAEELGEGFREVMVDEYQDTNEVQDRIFHALTQKKHNCFMVGDVKQSIYQFRLADPGIFLDKYDHYVPAENAKPKEGRKVLLSSNFRSSGGVIDAVNDVFSQYMSPSIGGLYYTGDEILKEGVPHDPLDEPEVEFYGINVEHDRNAEDAAFVANRIAELLDGTHMIRDKKDGFRKIEPKDIVILLRSPGSVGMDYLLALQQRGIRCTCEKGNDLLKTEEVAVLRSFLQVVSNPLQDIPLMATISSRVVGLNADEISLIRAESPSGYLFDALKQSAIPAAINFVELVTKLRKAVSVCTLSGLIEQILMLTSMDTIYRAMLDGRERVNNIYRFTQLASGFEANHQGDLDRFIEYLDNIEKGKGITVSDDNDTDAVRVMSIHKSKGLEFPVVFVSSLSKGFNDEDIKDPVLCDSELGLGVYLTDMDERIKYPNLPRKAIINKIRAKNISEEMRILYVALTRAKDRLIMTYSRVNIEAYIEEMILRMNMCPKELLARDVSSCGDWVLMTALQRSEAKALRSGDIALNDIRDYRDKWKISLIPSVTVVENHRMEEEKSEMHIPESVIQSIKERITFEYAHMLATKAPSKQTATQLKGRPADNEVNDNTYVVTNRSFRKPAFADTVKATGTVYGNAMHTAMQYLSYEKCADISGVCAELDRLHKCGYLSDDEHKMIDAEQIAAFFRTDIGLKLVSGAEVLREFKFSILDDGETYVPGMIGEKVLVQGVVDCAVIEDDGLIIVDFKTDRTNEMLLPDLVKTYTPQVKLYSRAMERIYQKPVKEASLYFFRIGKLVKV